MSFKVVYSLVVFFFQVFHQKKKISLKICHKNFFHVLQGFLQDAMDEDVHHVNAFSRLGDVQVVVDILF
jgi:hypothetical protein